jgi:hypothetical protein
MASGLTSDLVEFQAFVAERCVDRDDLTLEESLVRFRKYQQELESARAELAEAEAQSARGESGPLDAEALKSEVRLRLAAEGLIPLGIIRRCFDGVLNLSCMLVRLLGGRSCASHLRNDSFTGVTLRLAH